MSRWSILAALSLIRLSFGYQFEAMATLAPAVSSDLGLSQAQAGTLIGLYWAPGVLVALPGGWLGRRFGDKPMVLAGALLMLIGGIVAALGESYATLAAGRLIAGLGGIVMNVLAVKMTTDWFAGREIGFAMGALFGSFPLGIGLALLLQAPLAAVVGWPPVMASTAALAALVLAAIALVYRAPDGAAHTQEPPAATLLGRNDLVLMSLAGIALAIYNGSFLVYVSYAPILLTTNGLGVALAGAILAAASAVSTVFVPLGGHIADRSGRPMGVLLWATLAYTMCAAFLPWAAGAGVAAVTVVALFISMLGSLPVSPMVALPSAALPPARRAIGLGIFYTWFYLGAALCPALGGWLYGLAGTPAAPIYLIVALGLATIILYALFAVIRDRPKAPSGSAAGSRKC
jgi:predicted MFS family arabinose efflux permease